MNRANWTIQDDILARVNLEDTVAWAAQKPDTHVPPPLTSTHIKRTLIKRLPSLLI